MTLFPAPQKRGLLRRTTPTAPAIAVKPTAPFLWLGFVRSFVWPATLLLLVPPSLFHCLSWFLVPSSSLPTSGAIRLFAPTCFGMGIGEQKKLPRFGSQSGQNDGGGMTEMTGKNDAKIMVSIRFSFILFPPFLSPNTNPNTHPNTKPNSNPKSKKFFNPCYPITASAANLGVPCPGGGANNFGTEGASLTILLNKIFYWDSFCQ